MEQTNSSSSKLRKLQHASIASQRQALGPKRFFQLLGNMNRIYGKANLVGLICFFCLLGTVACSKCRLNTNVQDSHRYDDGKQIAKTSGIPLWLMGIWQVNTSMVLRVDPLVSSIRYVYINSVYTNDESSPYVTNGYVLFGCVLSKGAFGYPRPIREFDRMYINEECFYFGSLESLVFSYREDLNHRTMLLSNEYEMILLEQSTNRSNNIMISNIVQKLSVQWPQ